MWCDFRPWAKWEQSKVLCLSTRHPRRRMTGCQLRRRIRQTRQQRRAQRRLHQLSPNRASAQGWQLALETSSHLHEDRSRRVIRAVPAEASSSRSRRLPGLLQSRSARRGRAAAHRVHATHRRERHHERTAARRSSTTTTRSTSRAQAHAARCPRFGPSIVPSRSRSRSSRRRLC